MTRYAMPTRTIKDTDTFDSELTESVKYLERTAPEHWGRILDYLKSMAYPVEIDPERVELVCAEYHRKQYMIKAVRRLDGLEKI